MTWPATDVVRTNADAATKSPAAFRSDVLDLVDKFNLLRNHVSAFVQDLLNANNAINARVTLGAAARGANTDITSLAGLASLPTALMPLGAGQTWQNMSASRAMNTIYSNTTGRPITVTFSPMVGNGYAWYWMINGVLQTFSGGNTFTSMMVVVADGNTYAISHNASGEGPSSPVWFELR